MAPSVSGRCHNEALKDGGASPGERRLACDGWATNKILLQGVRPEHFAPHEIPPRGMYPMHPAAGVPASNLQPARQAVPLMPSQRPAPLMLAHNGMAHNANAQAPGNGALFATNLPFAGVRHLSQQQILALSQRIIRGTRVREIRPRPIRPRPQEQDPDTKRPKVDIGKAGKGGKGGRGGGPKATWNKSFAKRPPTMEMIDSKYAAMKSQTQTEKVAMEQRELRAKAKAALTEERTYPISALLGYHPDAPQAAPSIPGVPGFSATSAVAAVGQGTHVVKQGQGSSTHAGMQGTKGSLRLHPALSNQRAFRWPSNAALEIAQMSHAKTHAQLHAHTHGHARPPDVQKTSLPPSPSFSPSQAVGAAQPLGGSKVGGGVAENKNGGAGVGSGGGGGWLHVHANCVEDGIAVWVDGCVSALDAIALRLGRKCRFLARHTEKVKWYAPRIRHIVVDVQCVPLT